MRTTIAVLAAMLLLAACTSSGSDNELGVPTGPASGQPSTAEPGPNTSPSPVPKINIDDKWKAMKSDLMDGFGGTCNASSCTGTDPQSNATVTVSTSGVSPRTQVKVEYDAKSDTTNTSATLDLTRFALLFSSNGGGQVDFSGFVTDSLDDTPVGGSKSKVFAPLTIVVARPTSSKWVLTIKHS